MEKRILALKIRKKLDLTAAEAQQLAAWMLDAEIPAGSMRKLLEDWERKGVVDAEIYGFYAELRRRMQTITLDPSPIDICGSGGDGLSTLNISTGAALIVAGAGKPIAKYGNRSASSRAGAADLLEELGVSINLSRESVKKCYKETGFAFLYAPIYHPDMKAVAKVRSELGIPTIWNRVLFLLHPARASRRVIGLAAPYRKHIPLYGKLLADDGVEETLFVTGTGGMDEVSVTGPTDVTEAQDGNLRPFLLKPAYLGFEPVSAEPLRVKGVKESAKLLLAVLRGEETGVAYHTLRLNAAAGFRLLGSKWEEALEEADESIRSGNALRKLEEVVACSNALT